MNLDIADNRLFVYGTLAPGRPNEHVLADVPGDWIPASVRGDLVAHGWGASLGFPAIVLNQQAGEVDGFVFSSDQLKQHWDRLDAFEGEGYERVGALATIEGGSVLEVQVYALRQQGPESESDSP